MPAKSERPYVICYMMSSVDGKILSKNWLGTKAGKNSTDLYEKYHQKYDSQAWMCGRVTMERDFADGLYTHKGAKAKHTEDFIADPNAESFAIAIDAGGKLAWKENNIDGDHLVEVLTEQVSQGYQVPEKFGHILYFCRNYRDQPGAGIAKDSAALPG